MGTVWSESPVVGWPTLIGVRTLEQLKDCLGALDNLEFTAKELVAIDLAVKGALLDHRPPTSMAD